MAPLRAAFTASRQIFSTLLYTVVLHVYALILAAIMKRLGVAMGAVTGELLRRRDQLDGSDAPQPPSGSVIDEPLESSMDVLLQSREHDEVDIDHPWTESATCGTDGDNAVTRTSLHNSGITFAVSTHSYRRFVDMRTPFMRESPMAGTILAALRRQAVKVEQERTSQSISHPQSASVHPMQTPDGQEPILGCDEAPRQEKQPLTPAFRPQQSRCHMDAEPFHSVSGADSHDITISPAPSNARPWSYASPCSETTLADDRSTYSLNLPATTREPELIAVDNEGLTAVPTPVSSEKRTPGSTITRGRTQTRRFNFDEPARELMETPSRVLGDRLRTNNGLLHLRARTSREDNSPVRDHGHRRKFSLNLPVRQRTKNSQTVQCPSPKSHWMSAPNQGPETAMLAQEERELEYKHRHTFIGTASLDVFLEILEMSASHAVTMTAVMKAFTTLASNEQVLARQCSSRNDGWDVVSRITTEVQALDYIAQTHIKLGSITLRQFLDLIPFDVNERADAMAVLGAFCAASHMDSKGGAGTGSKARAFRSWMVRQGESGL